MLARLAENLFWAGRYIERAEDTALLLDVTYHGQLEATPNEAGLGWWGLLEVLHLDDAFRDAGRRSVSDVTVTRYLTLNERNPGSIRSCVARVRENAHSVRELVSSELWRVINSFHLELAARDLQADLDREPHELFDLVKLRCQTIYGVASETMPRDEAWRFMMLGRMLERAEMTCRLVGVRYAQLSATPHAGFHDWAQVLESVSAYEAYRKSYKATLEPAHVVEFLLLGEELPRSVLFCLRAAEQGLSRLAPPGVPMRAQRLLGRVRAELEYRDIDELLIEDLRAFLDRVQQQVWAVADAVASEFFRAELASDLERHATRAL